MVDNGMKKEEEVSLFHFILLRETAEIVITFRLPIEREGVGGAFVSVEGLSAQLDCRPNAARNASSTFLRF
jgi:hypothetical protein